jgi:dTDP-4-dehydrorhamnose reductase
MSLRILVAGARGQVASALAEECAGRRDISAICLGRPDFDITDPDNVERMINLYAPQIVVNAAAYTAVDKAESDEKIARAVNEKGSLHLAQSAARAGIPLIHLSTDYVFSGTKPTPYTETDEVGPLGVYGRTKLAGELAVARNHARHVILRTSWIYSHIGSNFVLTMLRLGKERDYLRIVDDQIGHPSYAPSIARGVLHICSVLNRHPLEAPFFGVFHLTGEGMASWYEFARAIFEESKSFGQPYPHLEPISSAEYPTPAARPLNSRLDGSRLRTVYGISLPHWRDDLDICLKRIFSPPPAGA